MTKKHSVTSSDYTLNHSGARMPFRQVPPEKNWVSRFELPERRSTTEKTTGTAFRRIPPQLQYWAPGAQPEGGGDKPKCPTIRSKQILFAIL